MPTFRTLLKVFKGRFNGLLDRTYWGLRRIHQKRLALRKTTPNGFFINVLCTSRSEYVKATVKCLNSFWEFNPEYSARIWLDAKFWPLRKDITSKLDRPNQAEFSKIPDPTREWQWNKLLIILEHLGPEDIFSDADIIWNGPLPHFQKPSFFLKEFDLMLRANTRHLLGFFSLKGHQPTFMYNVSFVQLKNLSRENSLVELSKDFYKVVRSCVADEVIGYDDIPPMRRMSEQIALSLAVQNLLGEDIDVLKSQDSIMDGGLAESYYLGSSAGWQ